MGSCQSFNKEFQQLVEVAKTEYHSKAEQMKANKIARTIIDKYQDLPEIPEFPWTHKYKDDIYPIPMSIIYSY